MRSQKTSLLVGAIALAGIAAATPARAAGAERFFGNLTCIGPADAKKEPPCNPGEICSPGLIYNAGQSTVSVLCVRGEKVRNIRRVALRLYDGNTGLGLFCRVSGRNDAGDPSFTTVELETGNRETGWKNKSVSLPSNQTRSIAVQCDLPKASPGEFGSALHFWQVETR
jgi:hypothetical protein